LVIYGIAYLASRPGRLDLDGFADFLLENGRRKDVDRCYRNASADVFFALAEFALWRFPLAKEDPFDFNQLVGAGGGPDQPMKALDMAGFYGLHTSKYNDDQPEVRRACTHGEISIVRWSSLPV
jgi:hypothetical protein